MVSFCSGTSVAAIAIVSSVAGITTGSAIASCDGSSIVINLSSFCSGSAAAAVSAVALIGVTAVSTGSTLDIRIAGSDYNIGSAAVNTGSAFTSIASGSCIVFPGHIAAVSGTAAGYGSFLDGHILMVGLDTCSTVSTISRCTSV